jgi:hypothetical protein
MRVIPDNNLAYPVLVTLNNGSSGSGFLLNTETHNYFITARHVLFDSLLNIKGDNGTLTCPSEEIDDDTTTVLSFDLKKLMSDGQVFKHSTADVAAITLGTITKNSHDDKYTQHLIDGVTELQTSKTPIVAVIAKNTTLLLRDVLISNDVFLYGYPSSLGLKKSPQFDYAKPLLRKGIVASVNKNQGTIILDCPVYYGNSGGPVIQVKREGFETIHKVIGVISQFIPYYENWQNQSNGLIHTELSNSGYSVAVAMDYVFEMLGIPML